LGVGTRQGNGTQAGTVGHQVDLGEAAAEAAGTCYASTDEVFVTTHTLLSTLVLAFMLGASGAAQVSDAVLSLDDGVRVQSIARSVAGQWVSASPCTPAEASARLDIHERLVVSGGVTSKAVRSVGPGTPEWLRLAPTITQAFERREREQRLTSDRTTRAPRSIDWIYAFDEGDAHTYYFEASRRVASASDDVDADTDPPGTIRVAVAGFLRAGRDGPISGGTKGELRWEQDGLPAGPSRPDLTPLGVVVYGDRSLWVMKGQSGTSRWFTLYEVGSENTRTALTVRFARC
jgi:hypothetical protein